MSPERSAVAFTPTTNNVREPSRLLRIAPAAICFIVYLAIALYAYSKTGFSSGLPGCACGDQAQEVNFIAWPTYALEHARNPFYTTWVNYPAGVNLAVNTSFPLLGLLATPIVLLAGPVAALNVLFVLSFCLSAFAMCMVLRRWVKWWPAAFVGGLVYGFSPFMMGQGWGHLFLTFIPIPPLMLLCLDEILIRRSKNSSRYGVLLGLLAAAQYLISDEVLALTMIVAVAGVVVLSILNWRIAVAHARHAVKALVIAAVVCGVIIIYPVYFSYTGPEHLTGPPQPLSGIETFPGDLLGPIVPTVSQWLAPVHYKLIGDRFTGRDVTENGLYLGIPLIVILGAIVLACRRLKTVIFFAVMLIVSFILALGPRLFVDTHNTGIRLPWTLFTHVPAIQDLVPVRFSLFVQMFAAIILAIGVDRAYNRIRSGRTGNHARIRPSLRRNSLAMTVPALVAVVALVPVIPKFPYVSADTNVPSLFDVANIKNIPTDSVVLTYPYPAEPEDQIMVPQALSNMRFKIIGGTGHVPHPAGYSPYGPSILQPLIVEQLFNAAYAKPGSDPAEFPPTTPQNLSSLRTFIGNYHVGTIVVYPFGLDPKGVVRFVSALLGAPSWNNQVVAWFDVQAKVSSVNPGS